MPFCPSCGKEVGKDDEFCKSCGHDLRPGEKKVEEAIEEAVESFKRADPGQALTKALNIISAKPGVLIPALIGASVPFLIGLVTSVVAFGGFVGAGFFSYIFTPVVFGTVILLALAGIIGLFVSFLMFFASIDMSRDAYLGQPLSVSGSVGYVIGRLGIFIVAAIVGAILSVTIILIPIAIFMFVIMVVDETGISDAISKSFQVAGDRLGDVIILFVVAIVGGAILNLVPVISPLLLAGWYVLLGLALMHLYYNYKKAA